ncbi:MAG: CHAT domain-containing protein, partial [Bacteroidota bacterium]
AVAYANAASLLQTLDRQGWPKRQHRIVAFAPTFNDPVSPPKPKDSLSIPSTLLERKFIQLRNELGPLPGAKRTTNFLKENFRAQVFDGQNVHDQLFKSAAANFDIIHFGTHAIIDDEYPLKSRLILSSLSEASSEKDLEMWELYGLNLPAQLAVLTACKTGSGTYKKGEGIISLARAFLMAGCPSVVTSLWYIGDEATSTINQSFYTYLAEGLTKDEALRRAKLDYLSNSNNSDDAHPFFWAGIIGIGNRQAVHLGPTAGISLNWLLGMGLALCTFLWFWYRKRKKN